MARKLFPLVVALTNREIRRRKRGEMSLLHTRMVEFVFLARTKTGSPQPRLLAPDCCINTNSNPGYRSSVSQMNELLLFAGRGQTPKRTKLPSNDGLCQSCRRREIITLGKQKEMKRQLAMITFIPHLRRIMESSTSSDGRWVRVYPDYSSLRFG